MDRLLKIGACLMTALLATGLAAAAVVDLAVDAKVGVTSEHGSGDAAAGGNAHADDSGATANGAGAANGDAKGNTAGGSSGGSASGTAPETRDVPVDLPVDSPL